MPSGCSKRVRRGRAELLADGGFVGQFIAAIFAATAKAARARLERAQAFLERFLEGPPDGHRLADRLHGGSERGVGAREFFKREPRIFVTT